MPRPRLLSSSECESELGLTFKHDSTVTSMTSPRRRRLCRCRVLCEPCTRSAVFKKNNTLTTRSVGLCGRGALEPSFLFLPSVPTLSIIPPLQSASALGFCPPSYSILAATAATPPRCSGHEMQLSHNLSPSHGAPGIYCSSTPAGLLSEARFS